MFFLRPRRSRKPKVFSRGPLDDSEYRYKYGHSRAFAKRRARRRRPKGLLGKALDSFFPQAQQTQIASSRAASRLAHSMASPVGTTSDGRTARAICCTIEHLSHGERIAR